LKRLLDSNGHNLRISEIHFGGGSPNIMDYGDFNNFFDNVLSFGDTSILEEVVIEVDVRTVDEDKLKHYKEKGINRLSFGIQDFDPKVQKAINRTQSLELVERLLRPDLRRGFKSVNFDLGD
jgi:oxygen-independent coproporphyrinogen-3 oxidase